MVKLKANLHFHSSDDPQDCIEYTFFEGIDEAARGNFEVLALTCHDFFVDKNEYREYAAKKNILFIPGIEKTIQKKHVVILNASKEAENIKNFEDLAVYKKNNPHCFIMAPHPYFHGGSSLKKSLENNINLFDAIEFSWFYSKMFNCNKRAESIAKKYNLPLIATSDTHILPFINLSYSLIEAEEKNIAAIFEAIRKKRFININPPKKIWREMIWPVLKFEGRKKIKLFRKNYLNFCKSRKL